MTDSSPPSPAQRPTGQVDLDEVRGLYDEGDTYVNFHAGVMEVAAFVPALVADLDAAREALREERAKVEALLLGDKALQSRIWLGEECARLKAERDALRYERQLLGMARRVLDLAAEGGHHGYDVDYIRNQAADVAQRIVDEIGHPATDEPALGPSFREQLAAAEAERDRMRPVVEAAREFAHDDDLDVLALRPATKRKFWAQSRAVDTYETQENTEQ